MSLAPSIVSADREAVRRGGFPAFIELAAKHVLPGGRYIRGWHHRLCAEHFEALYDGRCTTLVVNLPPGHMKSVLFSVLGPAWIWSQQPDYVFMCASYDPTVANTFAEAHKGLCLTPWFRERWGDIVVSTDAVGEFWTTHDGFRLSTSVQTGRGIGRHCNMYIIDDPIKTQAIDRGKGAVLEAQRRWFRNTVITRGKVGGDQRICLVMQRLHEEDLSAHLIETYADDPGFVHLSLPYRFEEDRRCVTSIGRDLRTLPNEELWPAGKKTNDVKRFVREEGGWNGATFRTQYQQDPAGGQNKVFRSETFRPFPPNAPKLAECISVMSIDPTFTGSERSDLMAVEVWGYARGAFWCFYADACVRGFVDAFETIKRIRAIWRTTYVVIEASANGFALIELFEKSMPGVVGNRPSVSKMARAKAASHFFAAGRVHFDKSAPWYDEKARDLVRFPGGAHDDRVDTTSQAILWLSQNFDGCTQLTDAMAGWREEMMAPNPEELPIASPSVAFGYAAGVAMLGRVPWSMK
jgi:predicted phage terminase large subunit-like protein